MGLLVVGVAAGILVMILLRLLIQYERDGIGRLGDSVASMEAELERMRLRVQNLEAIAATGEPGLVSSGARIEGERQEEAGESGARIIQERRTRA